MFKRGRVGKKQQRPATRTPRSSQSLYSYSSNRSVERGGVGRQPGKADESAKRQKRRVVQHIPSLLLLLAILASFVYLSTIDSRVRVAFVKTDDKSTTNLREASEYQTEAENFINHSIVNRSKFMFDSGGLENHLKQRFPEIAAASVSVPIMGRRPVVELQATRPAFILVSGTQSMLIGNNGVALVDAHDVKNIGGLGLRTVADQTGVELSPGKSALPQEQAQFISVILEQLEKQGYNVDTLTIPASPYDLHIKLKDTNYYIKFNILEDPKQQAGSYVALRKKLDADKVTPSEYVDVRVGERVYYK